MEDKGSPVAVIKEIRLLPNRRISFPTGEFLNANCTPNHQNRVGVFLVDYLSFKRIHDLVQFLVPLSHHPFPATSARIYCLTIRKTQSIYDAKTKIQKIQKERFLKPNKICCYLQHVMQKATVGFILHIPSNLSNLFSPTLLARPK